MTFQRANRLFALLAATGSDAPDTHTAVAGGA